MSMRFSGGIVLPGYNPLGVANAPTIGTAAPAGSTSVSVAFTAPACIGGAAISSYTVFANCGIKTATGTASPLTVTGLTTGTAYTFKAIATNAYGLSYPSAASNSATPPVAGQQAYTTVGSYSWVVPACVTSISVVAVGAGGGAGGAIGYCSCYSGVGGGGGALAYANNISVTPGETLSITVGSGGAGSGNACFGTAGGSSSFTRSGTNLVLAYGGFGGKGGGYSGPSSTSQRTAPGGISQTFYSGGGSTYSTPYYGGGGGGAGGYAGVGGAGIQNNSGFNSGAGGAGAGGGYGYANMGYGGGGVGILGQGSNGTGNGGGGSSGCNGGGGQYPTQPSGGAGGVYGGGGGGGASGFSYSPQGGTGAKGAVRIIWPGNTRSFPSTCTGNL